MTKVSDGTKVVHREADPAAPRPGRTRGREFLVFRLGDETHAVDVQHVQEIRSYEVPRGVADAPPPVTGVLMLRGGVVPIVDTRMRLGCSGLDIGPTTVVIVLDLRGRRLGVVADAVLDILRLDGEPVDGAPALARASAHASSVAGKGWHERKPILLDIEALLTSARLGPLELAAV